MYKGTYHKDIIDGLERAISGESFTAVGICLILQSRNQHGPEVFNEIRGLMSKVIRELGFHSNNEMFPIAPPSHTANELLVCAEASLAYGNRTLLWNPEDAYCARRIAVAKELIAILKGERESPKPYDKAIDALTAAVEGRAENPRQAICQILHKHIKDVHILNSALKAATQITKSLGFYNDSKYLFIQPPKDGSYANAKSAFVLNYDNMWKTTDEYCQRRIAIAKLLIQALKAY